MGDAWSACVGEVLPEDERCDTSRDDDCDGEANEGCTCAPGEAEACYEGPAGTAGVGVCLEGVRVCKPDGRSFGACTDVLPSLDDCVSSADEDCDGVPLACTGDANAPVLVGGGADDGALALALGADGSVVVAGVSDGWIEYSSVGVLDGQAYVAKLARDGTVQWSIAPGTGATPEAIEGVDVDDVTGDVLLAGTIRGSVDFGGGTLTTAGNEDVLVARLGPDGSHVFSRVFGDGGSQVARDVAIDVLGNAYVTGWFAGQMVLDGITLTSAGDIDAFVVKLDPAGSVVWARQLGDAASQFGIAIEIASDGTPWVAGGFAGSILTSEGTMTSADGYDAFLVAFNTSGIVTRGLRLGGSLDQYAHTLGVHGTTLLLGGIAVGTLQLATGDHVTDGVDGWVAAFDGSSAGDAETWARVFAGPGDTNVKAVAADEFGNVVVGGWFTAQLDLGASGSIPVTYERDAFVAKLDPSGEVVWGKAFGGLWTQYVTAIATDAQARVVTAGHHWGEIDFGSGPQPAANQDLFLVTLEP